MGYVFDALQGADDNDKWRFSEQWQTPTETVDGQPAEHLQLSQSPDESDPQDSRMANVDDRLVGLTSPSGAIAEEYRAIRTGLLAKWEHRRHLVHTITSATPQEGKTLTSLNLGLIFAELHNRKTIVVEGDLRLPQFNKLLDLPDSPGLTGVLREGADLASSIHQVGDNRLHVLCAGRHVNNQAVQLLSSTSAASLLAFLKKEYDHVIVDTPPVVELADAGIIGAMSDEVLLIVRMNRTPRSLVDQAMRTLAGYNAPVSSLLATDQTYHRKRYYYYRYGYRYHYRYKAKAA